MITTSIANLWTHQTSFMAQVLIALQDEGALSPQAIHQLLRRLDDNADALDGEDDRQYATAALASVRNLLDRSREG
ncbi:hypothetical protein [Sphingomonas gellani]|uniref:hypothetical protein n=1 Tax=Sphingomonas gellani TaxID=1166340 RepID=UPI000B862608|nr:hypothetical protein [Sphingomonas gellani]